MTITGHLVSFSGRGSSIMQLDLHPVCANDRAIPSWRGPDYTDSTSIKSSFITAKSMRNFRFARRKETF